MTQTAAGTSPRPVDPTGTWTVDAAASDLTFAVPDMVLGRPVRGRFADLEGLIGLHPAGCRAILLVDAGSLVAGSSTQGRWLRSAAFLDAGRHPYVCFRSVRVRGCGADRSILLGELTVRDVTRRVRCAVRTASVGVRDGRPDRIRFTGLVTLSRADFGLGTDFDDRRGGPLLGDRVDIEFALGAVRRRTTALERRSDPGGPS